MAPTRRGDLARLGPRALLAGFLATLINACDRRRCCSDDERGGSACERLRSQPWKRREFLRGRGFGGADVAVVLGSGLGDFADGLAEPFEVPYADIPHWPASPRRSGTRAGSWAALARGRRVMALCRPRPLLRGASADHGDLRDAGARAARRAARHPDERGRRHQHPFRPGRADGDRRSHQPDGQQPAGRPQRRPLRRAVSRHDARSTRRACAGSPTRPPRPRPACRSSTASTSRSTARATRRRRRFARSAAIGADAVGMSTVPGGDRRAAHGPRGAGHLVHHQHGGRRAAAPLRHDEVMETARRVRGQFIALLEGIIERL